MADVHTLAGIPLCLATTPGLVRFLCLAPQHIIAHMLHSRKLHVLARHLLTALVERMS